MKFKLVILIVSLLLVMVPTVVYAADYYHNTVGDTSLADEAPYYGNWWWGHRSSNRIVWEIHDYWSQDNANRLRNGQYRMEVEAYKYRPWWQGGSLYCDQLNVASVHTFELPVTHYSVLNECGQSDKKELILLHLNESSIQGWRWYRHYHYFSKVTAPSGGEVNYSFSYDPGNDLWLGKIYYNSSFNATSSDRVGLLNLY